MFILRLAPHYFAVFLFITVEAIAAVRQGFPGFVVFGYLPEWRYEALNWETAAEHVSHIILFSMEMSGDGNLKARDRFPREELLIEARKATKKHGSRVLLCFGGNGRSSGFSAMVKSSASRKNFIQGMMRLVEVSNIDGIDYNWEYPGYSFGKGYSNNDKVMQDYSGLLKLLRETREAFDAYQDRKRSLRRLELTMAYYPDGRQEKLIKFFEMEKYVDYFHMMAYDQHGEQHSSFEFAMKSVDLGTQRGLPLSKMTLGLPFYGRDVKGDWTTYEDMLQRYSPLFPGDDIVGTIGYNSVETIKRKVAMSIQKQIGGVMIWEIGQDCRLIPTYRGDSVHAATCTNGTSDSLLYAITETIMKETKLERYRAEDWVSAKLNNSAFVDSKVRNEL